MKSGGGLQLSGCQCPAGHICIFVFYQSSPTIITIIIIIIMNFYSPVSNTRCHSIGHKMRIARIKIRVDSPGRWERA